MPKPKRRGRRILVILGVLLLLVFFSPLLLGLGFARSKVESTLSESIGLPVTIKDASAFWFKGLTLEGIRIDSPEGFDEPLARIKRVDAKVDLLALLGGRVEAEVEVLEPRISFQEDLEGRRNTDGLTEEAPATDAPSPQPKTEAEEANYDIALRIRDGVVSAKHPSAELPDEIRGLNVDLRLDGEAGLSTTLEALALRAGVGGGDVAVKAKAILPESGRGEVQLEIPPIDLARVRHLMRGVAGVRDLRGTVEMKIAGDLAPDEPVPFKGTTQTLLRGLAMRLDDGSPVSIGEVTLDVDLNPDDPKSAGRAVLEVKDLRVGPGSLSHRGHHEPKISVRFGGVREGDAYVLELQEATSSFFRAGTAANEPPLRLTVEGDQTRLDGVSELSLALAPLARAFGAAMGLEPDDTMGGTLSLALRAQVDDKHNRVNAGLLGRGVVLPRSWGAEGLPPAEIRGKLNVDADDVKTVVDVPTLKGFGLDLKAEATMTDAGLKKAQVEVTGELGRARPLLGAFLELDRRESLQGRLEMKSDVVPEGDGQRITARMALKGFRWTDAEGRLIVNEPSVTIAKNVFLGKDGEQFRIDEWKMLAGALAVGLEGSGRMTKIGDYDLDASMTLAGDAAGIAPTLARFLGAGYEDLKGQGRVEGTVRLSGPTTDGGAGLLANGAIQPGSWNAGGLALASPKLTLSRASASVPQSLVVESGVNDGTLRCVVTTKPSAERTPWTVGLVIRNVDTSPLVVDRGLGEYLTYLLPTLLPADTGAQVLTGRLDTDIQLRAMDLSGDVMTQTLAGNGEIKMKGGSIGQSTLFRVAGSRGGLGQAGQLLAKAVPEVGRELEGLAKAMTFRKVESRFDVATEIVKIRHGLLEGDSATITFQGTVGFDERVDLDLSLTLGGKGGEALRPILGSATIPLAVKGTLEDPKVKPSIDTTKLATGALKGLIPGRGDGKKENPLDRLKGLLPR